MFSIWKKRLFTRLCRNNFKHVSISTRNIFMPPAVEPMLPPTAMAKIRVSFDPSPIFEMSNEANPVHRFTSMATMFLKRFIFLSSLNCTIYSCRKLIL